MPEDASRLQQSAIQPNCISQVPVFAEPSRSPRVAGEGEGEVGSVGDVAVACRVRSGLMFCGGDALPGASAKPQQLVRLPFQTQLPPTKTQPDIDAPTNTTHRDRLEKTRPIASCVARTICSSRMTRT